MSIVDLTTAGAIPTLGNVLRFAGRRQQLIAHNIANFSTPDFRPMDVSPEGFQAQLAGAVDRRRRTGLAFGELQLERTREVEQTRRGDLLLRARSTSGNILFHDRNNRDVERTMQDMVENAGMFNLASTFLRQAGGQLRQALTETT